ncbi:DUF1800 domain-containing protein [Novosphingobium sp. SCN 63-17]|uniref:DUF1800 domain-containing protein n=1 Tax=Novosphingobium sp. SCN 63-17 TaxID=1660120 RepID=UPI0008697A8C|nr:DUF1800 domain-containing protein [Novosphingobium sp. SCN 63-17]ODU79136.1 MAG: hypothetical protein ABT10_21210 [Novosphingobium sp. SCN 63-17]
MRRPLLGQSLAALALALVARPALAEDKPSPDLDMAMLNRLTWGATSAEVQRMRAMGAEAWLQAELHPPAAERLPVAAQAMIDALPARTQNTIALVRELHEQVAAAKAAQAAMAPSGQGPGQGAASTGAAPSSPMQAGPSGATATQPPPPAPLTPQEVRRDLLGDAFRQDQTRLILRALYAPSQLREQLTAFWLNHFNVYADKAEIRLFVRDYEDQAIRPHALGRFRDLLEATLRSPAMLQYLDNAQNAKGRINENYAREIMELHTMGVGSGYTQKDVQELARILTGVGIVNPDRPERPSPANPAAIRDGMFAFYPGRHDMGDKVFLGHAIKGSGYDEVRQALDILCAQPATARHVSRQLAQYFVADSPPPALVERMTARWAKSGGDIAAVLDLLFHSPEFRASLSHPLLKDPQHFVLSAVRMAYDDRVIANTQPIANWLNRLGQPFYGHLTPDGYPLERTAWNGPGQIEQRFEIAQAIGTGSAGLFKGEAPSATPRQAFPVLQGALYYGGLDKQLSPGTRTALDQAASPQEWNVLFLASPDFMGR